MTSSCEQVGDLATGDCGLEGPLRLGPWRVRLVCPERIAFEKVIPLIFQGIS